MQHTASNMLRLFKGLFHPKRTRRYRRWPDHGPSGFEKLVQAELRRLGIPFAAHHVFGPYTADLYFPQYNAIVECDGIYWHTLPGRPEGDARRDRWFAEHGIRTIRLTDAKFVHNHQAAVIWALRELQERR